MFKKNVKKVVSIIIAVMMLASMTTVMAANDVTVVKESDFSDYTEATGTAAPNGFKVFNANGTGNIIMPDTDTEYGTVVKLDKAVDCWSPMALGFYPSNLAADKSFVMETAVKVENKGAAFAIEMYSPTTRVVSFGTDGYIAVAGTKVCTYETNVWYDVKAEYISSSKSLVVTVDGGAYDNMQFAASDFSDITPTEVNFGYRDVTSSAATVYIGYFKSYQTTFDKVYSFIENFENYTNNAGNAKPNGFEFSGVNGTAITCTPVADATYGTAARVTKIANNSSSGCIEKKNIVLDSSKLLFVETAIRTNAVSTVTIDAWPNQFVRFDASGDFYVGHINGKGGTKIGKYEADTWYELIICYDVATGNLAVTVDGGMYDNTTVKVDSWATLSSGFALDMGYRDWSSHTSASTADFGYLRIYTKPEHEFYNNITTTFDGYKTGALTDNAISGTQYCNGFAHKSGDSTKFNITETSDSHGKVLSVSDAGEWSAAQYYLDLNSSAVAPFAQKITSGTYVVEYSAKLAKWAKTNIICDTASAGADGKAYFSTGYITAGNKFSGLAISEDKWYRIVAVINIGGDITQYIYEEDNPANCAKETKDISANGAITKISLASYGIDTTNPDVLIDDIRVYTGNELAFESKSDFADDYVAMLNQKAIFEFNAPFKYALAEVKANGEVLPANDYTISKCGNYVVVAPKALYNEETNYEITLTQVCDVFDNIIKNVGTVAFSTGKLIDISAPVFQNASGGSEFANGEFSATVNFTFGDGNSHNVKMFFALYNKTTHKFESADYDSKSITKDSITLSLNVTDCANSYARLYVWKDNLAPYITDVKISK